MQSLHGALDAAVTRLALRLTLPTGRRAAFVMLSSDPPVFHVWDWGLRHRLPAIERTFRILGERRACFLHSVSSLCDDPEPSGIAAGWLAAHRARFPLHRFVYLSQTPAERDAFRRRGLEAILCNQNCVCDETVFRPLPGVARDFDAVYDARLSSVKRHELAAKIPRLALIAYRHTGARDRGYIAATRELLAHAHWFNDPCAPDYRRLAPAAVAAALNRCRVGLCLSAVEGAMFASAQYLLAGLPVVSTRSVGGRDVFFDDDYVAIVEDDAEAVADGVKRMIERDVPAATIRERTLEKMRPHRQRLIELVQDVYRRHGVRRDFAAEWSKALKIHPFQRRVVDAFGRR